MRSSVIHPPIPSLDFLAGLKDIGPLLIIAVPLGIYNFTEGMNNVESAGAAGDQYDLRQVLLADGVGALAGALLGSPFPPAVYIGHPGWKAVGGRIGYSLATGIVVALVCFLGLTALLLAVVPLVAILPILLYIGLVIGAQAFESTPARHAPAVILAMLPNIASWAQNQIDGALAAAGTSASEVGFDKLAGHGVIYHGLALFGGGGTLTGLMLGATAAYIIDRAFDRAAIYALGAAVLAFFGIINGTALGFGNSAMVALGYLIVAFICFGMRLYAALQPLVACPTRPLSPPMTDPSDLDALIAAVPWLFGIAIRPEWRDPIRLHLSISLDHARNVADYPLPDDADPAPVFTA